MIFERHGDVGLSWAGNLLIVAPSGAINEEAAMNFNKKIEESVCLHRKNNTGHWYRMEYFADPDTLFTPEVINLLTQSLCLSKRSGCKQIFVVGGNSCVKQIASDCSYIVQQPCRVFSDLDEWRDWTQKEGLFFDSKDNELLIPH